MSCPVCVLSSPRGTPPPLLFGIAAPIPRMHVHMHSTPGTDRMRRSAATDALTALAQAVGIDAAASIRRSTASWRLPPHLLRAS